jgi:hypothetical protein
MADASWVSWLHGRDSVHQGRSGCNLDAPFIVKAGRGRSGLDPPSDRFGPETQSWLSPSLSVPKTQPFAAASPAPSLRLNVFHF